MTGALPRRHRVWFSFCLAGLAALLATRLVYYSPLPLSPGAETWLQAAMMREMFESVLVLLAVGAGHRIVPAVFLAVLVLRRRWLFRRTEHGWGTTPVFFSLLWAGILFGHGFFDVNPRVALGCALSLPLFFPATGRPLDRLPARARGPARLALWLAFAGACQLLARDAADAAALLLWFALLAALTRLARGRWIARDRFTAAVACVPLVQVVAAVLPLGFDLHGGRALDEGMAYSFCESPERGRLYVAVPRCDTHWPDLPECQQGFVAEYSLPDLTRVARHRVLSERFYGRIEQLVCLEDTVQIGMNRTIFEGEPFVEDAMEFSMDDPTRVTPHLLGEAGGHRIYHDRRRDALLYLGADVRNLIRIDRRTGAVTRLFEEGAASQRLANAALHEGRNSLFAVGARAPVREIDLTTLEVVDTFPHGGATEVSVDEELGRLYGAGFWGVEVRDLESGRLVARKRLGLITRQPTTDFIHGLVYVPTMAEGKIHVFDRASFEHLGSLPVGLGGRYPHVSRDGAYLFASSHAAHYSWSAPELARRLRGEEEKRSPSAAASKE